MSHRALFFARFLAFFTLFVGSLHWYVWRRLVHDIGPSRRVRTWAAVGYGLLIVVFLWGGMGGRFLGPSPTAVRWVANIWLGVLGLLVGVLLCLDAARAVAWLIRRRRVTPGTEPHLAPGRRLFLARVLAGVATSAAAGLAAIGTYEGLRRVRIKKVEVTLDKLPAAADGYRIAQISDVHIGPTLGRDFVEEVVAGIQQIQADLIVITGDLIDGDVATLDPKMQALRELRAHDGVFFVTGNHEYYAGAEQWLRHLPTLGIRPLQNERIRLPAFELAGIPDWTAEDFRESEPADMEKAISGRDPALPLILLAHQPRHAPEAMECGVDLQLAGHTHGGQMFPMTWLIHLAYPFIAGLYRRGNFQIYVSSGTGYWGPPMRLGTQAEITEITLRRPV
jgi:uncharacterized protein